MVRALRRSPRGRAAAAASRSRRRPAAPGRRPADGRRAPSRPGPTRPRTRGLPRDHGDGRAALPGRGPRPRRRDREDLVSDRARRPAMWRSLGPPGVVVAGGEVACIRRTRQEGTAPEITVEPFRPLVAAHRPARDEEAARAGRRACGCRSGEASPTLGGRTFLRALFPADRDPWSSRALRTSRRAGLQ
ncbi:DNA glycosylase AlkZ-like family protein [Pseudonocardia sp. T1-2H]|uniref:DNA glycosylase AlkZ-like family protein n=1 Tax=Pseudonocardia sp. T1-2H TaxID=3128899 RepID=UPI00405462E9